MINKYIDQQIQKIFTTDHFIKPFKQTLRASYQPFCPRRYFLDVMHQEEPRPCGIRSDMILEIGTTIHNMIQKWLPTEVEVFGGWECRECDWKTEPVWSPKDGICPKCGGYLKYNELEFKNEELGISGHCDGIFRYKDNIYLMEYKTTGDYSHVKSVYPSHRIQDTFYAFEYEKKYGNKIKEVCIVYFDREVGKNKNWKSGFIKAWKSFSFVPNRELYDIYLEFVKYGKSCIDRKKLPKYGICTNKHETYFCPHAEYCFKKSSNPSIKNDSKVLKYINAPEGFDIGLMTSFKINEI